MDPNEDVVRPDGDSTQGSNPVQNETEAGSLEDIDRFVNDVLGESGLTEDELIEIVEEEVPLVSDPGMATNAGAGKGIGKGWMLLWFFLLLLLIAIFVGRAAYKKIESKMKEADEQYPDQDMK